VIKGDAAAQFCCAEADLDIGLDPARPEYLGRARAQIIGNQHFGHCGLRREKRFIAEDAKDAPRAQRRFLAPSRPLRIFGVLRGKALLLFYAALAASRSCSQAQSSHGRSASTSLCSTVAPAQMRMPGGEARWLARS